MRRCKAVCLWVSRKNSDNDSEQRGSRGGSKEGGTESGWNGEGNEVR